MRGVCTVLLLLLFSPVSEGAGDCDALRPWYTCSPPCQGSCHYYIFEDKTISMDIDRLPIDLSPLKPPDTDPVTNPHSGFCDHQGEGHLSTILRKIPYNLGPYAPSPSPTTTNTPAAPPPPGPFTLRKLPTRPVLGYKKWTKKFKVGPPCPGCSPPSCTAQACSGCGGTWTTCTYTPDSRDGPPLPPGAQGSVSVFPSTSAGGLSISVTVTGAVGGGSFTIVGGGISFASNTFHIGSGGGTPSYTCIIVTEDSGNCPSCPPPNPPVTP